MAVKLNKKQIIMAKLFAEENIIVVQNDSSTASFNVESRVLTMPMWDLADDQIHMMLITHEVGHALFTPQTGWKDITSKHPHIGIDPFNVIEDIRIERMMIEKYPGLLPDYLGAYRTMFNGGLFGQQSVEGKWGYYDIWSKINIWGKLRGQVEVPMTSEELAFAKEATMTQTWEDVVDLVERIYDRYFAHKHKKAEKFLIDHLTDVEFPEDGFDGEIALGEDKEEEKAEKEKVTAQPEVKEGQEMAVTDKMIEHMENSTPSGDSNGPGVNGGIGGTGEGQDEDDEESEEGHDLPKVDTVMAAKEYMAELSSATKHDNFRFAKTFGKNFCAESLVYGIDQVMEARRRNPVPLLKARRKEIKQAAMLMLKEFEMRRQADRMARAGENQTGTIDVTKLHTYKFSDKIFKKIAVIPDGQSHCALMLIDFSYSMKGSIKEVFYQTAILATFCRLAKIPFRVFAFTSKNYYGAQTETYSEEEAEYERFISFRGLGMAELISSSMSEKDFSDAIGYMIGPSMGYCPVFRMGGTPLGEAVILAGELLTKLQVENQCQKSTLITLTDGAGSALGLTQLSHDTSIYTPGHKMVRLESSFGTIYFKNGYDVHVSIQEAMMERGITVIGYDVRDHFDSSHNVGQYKDMLKDSGVAVSKIKTGFDRHMVINRGTLDAIAKDKKNLAKEDNYEEFVKRSAVNRKMSKVIARNVSETMG